MSLKEVEMGLARRLAAEDTYQFNSFALEEGQVYHATYSYKEPESAGAELVYLFLRATAPKKLTAVFLHQPKLLHKCASAAVQQYVN